MDEEVKWGENTKVSDGYDITNGASPDPVMKRTYGFMEEYREVITLLWRHSRIYLAKFVFLVTVTAVACVVGDSYSTLIISSFTILGSLLFDQLCKKKIPENFDFVRAEKFCDIMTAYVLVLFFVSLFFLCTKDTLLPGTEAALESFDAISSEGFWTLGRFRWAVFCLCCSADFSALVEGIANIPEWALPSNQQKQSETSKNN